MKLFAKIFLCGTLVFCTAILTVGYLLISYSYDKAITREIDYTLTRYQYDQFTLRVRMLTDAVDFNGSEELQKTLLTDLAGELRGLSAFYNEEGKLLFSNLPKEVAVSLTDLIAEDSLSYQIQEADEKVFVVVCGKVVQSENTLYLATASDISMVVSEQRLMIDYLERVYIMALIGSMLLMLFFSLFLTRPIKQLNRAAGRIADGNYGERLPVGSKDEIGELAVQFNRMAETVEEKIKELSDNARQKEDFVASFAHELKTPLTSVIGYADMLYQQKITEEGTREAAWYILNEGLRLEALSLKLMDIIILNRQEFVLEEMQTEELLQDIVYGLMPILKDKGITCHLEVENTYIKVEYDLFKTLLLNLVDNAMKAESTEIMITGICEASGYRICVADNGRGIPDSELERITEAFYTVDKSRSRKQHGAGLGLALVKKITEIHGGRLFFGSQPGKGTQVTLVVDRKVLID